MYERAFTLSPIPTVNLLMLSAFRQHMSTEVKEFRFHDAWVLNCPLDPCGRYRIGEADQPWRERPAGEVHLYPPATVFAEDIYGGKRPRPIRGHYAIFTLESDECFSRFFSGGERYARVDDPTAIVANTISRLADYAEENTFDSRLLIQGEFLKLLSCLARNCRSLGLESWTLLPTTPQEKAHLSDKVSGYLQKHLAEKITLAMLAKEFQVSLSCLTHRFHCETGSSPMKLLTELRVARAKALLMRGEKLAHIAARSGFCDEYHLAKTFKKQTGQTPGQYRQRLQG